MPDYRFTTPTKQANLIEFGMSIGEVCDHMKAWGFTLSNIRVKTARLTFFSSGTIPANQLAHLDLEPG